MRLFIFSVTGLTARMPSGVEVTTSIFLIYKFVDESLNEKGGQRDAPGGRIANGIPSSKELERRQIGGENPM